MLFAVTPSIAMEFSIRTVRLLRRHHGLSPLFFPLRIRTSLDDRMQPRIPFLEH